VRPSRFKESSVGRHQIWVPIQNTRFLLLSTNLAWERLQIRTDLLPIITSTADELSGVPTSMTLNDLERPWTPKIGVLVNFFSDFRLRHTFEEWTALKLLEREHDNAYEIKLMLSRVSWTLGQIFFAFLCRHTLNRDKLHIIRRVVAFHR